MPQLRWMLDLCKEEKKKKVNEQMEMGVGKMARS
jgi:hypothetical protein